MIDTSTRRHAISSEDEIDLRRLLRIFWKKRMLIAVTTLLFGGTALILALVVPKKYTAETLLMPVEGSSGALGGASSMLAKYSGLASLVGISMPGNKKGQEYIALLKSTLITESFIRKYSLLPILYSDRWDPAQNRWRPSARIPTLWEGSQYFKKKIRSITENDRTGLVTLRIDWKNPVVAARWANALVQLTNEYARHKAVDKAIRDIAFLDAQAAETKYVEERQDIFSIIQGELTKEMLAKGADEYALKVIDPAFAPEKPTFPKPILWTVLGLCVGVMLGCGYALLNVDTTNADEDATELRDSSYSVPNSEHLAVSSGRRQDSDGTSGPGARRLSE